MSAAHCAPFSVPAPREPIRHRAGRRELTSPAGGLRSLHGECPHATTVVDWRPWGWCCSAVRLAPTTSWSRGSSRPRPRPIPTSSSSPRAPRTARAGRGCSTVSITSRSSTIRCPRPSPACGCSTWSAGRLLFQELVAHGRNTGERVAEHFSNVEGSKMSSLGPVPDGRDLLRQQRLLAAAARPRRGLQRQRAVACHRHARRART